MPDPANPQSWNRYSYVINNPLLYTDPTGHMFASDSYKDSDGKCDKGDRACTTIQDKTRKKNQNKQRVQPPAKLDLLFDPYYGSYINSLNDGSLTIEQLQNIDSMWESSDKAYDYYGIPLKEIARTGGLNPLTVNQMYMFLEFGPPETVLVDRSTHEPYSLFLHEVGKKMNPDKPTYLLGGGDFYMQFEPNYLSALMDEHQDALYEAKFVYSENAVADGLQAGTGDILQYIMQQIKWRSMPVIP